jgi:hypothetical protein
VSQWLAGISCVAAVAILAWQSLKKHDPKNLWANRANQS